MRSVRAYEADAVSAALHSGGALRRQHGTRDVQHRAGVAADAHRRTRLLLLGLLLGQCSERCRESGCSRRSRAGLLRPPVALLRRDAAAGGRGLLDQRIFSRAWRGVGESLSTVRSALDRRRREGGDGVGGSVSGERRSSDAVEEFAAGVICAEAAGSGVGRWWFGAGERE